MDMFKFTCVLNEKRLEKKSGKLTTRKNIPYGLEFYNWDRICTEAYTFPPFNHGTKGFSLKNRLTLLKYFKNIILLHVFILRN